jgi:hypothetical protein
MGSSFLWNYVLYVLVCAYGGAAFVYIRAFRYIDIVHTSIAVTYLTYIFGSTLFESQLGNRPKVSYGFPHSTQVNAGTEFLNGL